MENITGDEPSMPIWFEGNLGQMNSTGGLSIRQHFAAMAMQGFISSIKEGYQTMHRDAAEQAVEFADALIAELNKPIK